jgi:hypothetical protein
LFLIVFYFASYLDYPDFLASQAPPKPSTSSPTSPRKSGYNREATNTLAVDNSGGGKATNLSLSAPSMLSPRGGGANEVFVNFHVLFFFFILALYLYFVFLPLLRTFIA